MNSKRYKNYKQPQCGYIFINFMDLSPSPSDLAGLISNPINPKRLNMNNNKITKNQTTTTWLNMHYMIHASVLPTFNSINKNE